MPVPVLHRILARRVCSTAAPIFCSPPPGSWRHFLSVNCARCWLLPGRALDQAVRESEHLREAVAAMPTGLPVTISIGVAALERDEDASSLLARADQALYTAKREGRDRVCALP